MDFICPELNRAFNGDPIESIMDEKIIDQPYIQTDNGRKDKYSSIFAPYEKFPVKYLYLKKDAWNYMSQKGAYQKSLTIAQLATLLDIVITNNWSDSAAWVWNFRKLSELESPYFYTVFTDTGIQLIAPRRSSTSKYIGALNDNDLILQISKEGTVNWLGEASGSDFYINPIGNEPAIPTLVTSAEKKLALDKWKSKADIITFESSTTINLGDWVLFNQSNYIILSKYKNGNKIYYRAVKECNQTYTITTANVYSGIIINPTGFDDGELVAYNLAGNDLRSLGKVLADFAMSAQSDSIHLVGAAGEPAFANSWVNAGSPWMVACFTKDNLGYVHIWGFVKSGTATAGTTIFTLPAGYRPSAHLTFACISNSLFGGGYVLSDGRVQIQTGSNTNFGLSIPAFKAA